MSSFFIGLDIGGTNIRIASLDKENKKVGNIKKVPFIRLKTAQEEVDANVCDQIKHYVEENSFRIEDMEGIGISSAPIFNRENGEIILWPNNQLWNSYPLKKYLHEVFKVPVVIEDDANAAALGEYSFGAGRGHENFAYITVSTGIGCGLIIGGSLYKGENGWAGEIGHIKVSENGTLCKCGMTGCLQAVASGPALLEKSRWLSQQNNFDPSSISDLDKVVELAQKGSTWAREVFKEAGVYLASAIANIMMLLDISLVVIGGGVVQAGDLLLEPIKQSLYPYSETLNRNIEIKPAVFQDNNGLLGALSLIFNHVNNVNIADYEWNIENETYHRSSFLPDVEQLNGEKNKKKRIAVINGPNINLLGIREVDFYGRETLDSIENKLRDLANELNIDIVFFQSNHEGSIIDFIQENMFMMDAVVINPAACTITGYGILDALTSTNIPFVEVHLSNIFSRGSWHAESIFSEKAVGQVIGFKSYVYYEGLRAIANYINKDDLLNKM